MLSIVLNVEQGTRKKQFTVEIVEKRLDKSSERKRHSRTQRTLKNRSKRSHTAWFLDFSSLQMLLSQVSCTRTDQSFFPQLAQKFEFGGIEAPNCGQVKDVSSFRSSLFSTLHHTHDRLVVDEPRAHKASVET